MQTITALNYGSSKTVAGTFEDTLARVKQALQREGFGVQSQIDISEALKEKMGVDMPRQVILGACNPQLAFQALQLEPEIGLLLPCNVTLTQKAGAVDVAVVDAGRLMEFVGNPALQPIAQEATRRLHAVLQAV
jgi:uncharacterized protein (DUF302 family)